MGSNVKWIAILVIAQFSVVLCRNSFYEYYYSRFHHKRSTTEALSSSISDISSEENTRPSVSGSTAEALSSSVPGDIVIGNILHGAAGNAILQNILNSGKGDQAVEVDRNITNILYGDGYYYYYYRQQADLQITFGILGGCFAFFFLLSLCVFCIVRSCRRGSGIRRGFIIRNPQAPLGAQPQQPVVSQQYQQHPVAQPYPVQCQVAGSAQLLISKEQSQPDLHFPVQQQYEFSQVVPQSHNQAEAPPAYPFPQKF